MNTTQQLLTSFARELPMFLVLLMGAIVAIVYMSRAPLASTLVLVGCGLLLCTTLVSMFGFDLLRRLDLGNLVSLLAIANGIFKAIGVATIIGAVFAGRNETPLSSPPQQFRP